MHYVHILYRLYMKMGGHIQCVYYGNILYRLCMYLDGYYSILRIMNCVYYRSLLYQLHMKMGGHMRRNCVLWGCSVQTAHENGWEHAV
jgi:hypothetical protein